MKFTNLLLLGIGGLFGVAAVKGYEIAQGYFNEKSGEPVNRPCADCPINRHASYGKAIVKKCHVVAGKGRVAVKSGIEKGTAYGKRTVSSVKAKIQAKKASKHAPVEEIAADTVAE